MIPIPQVTEDVIVAFDLLVASARKGVLHLQSTLTVDGKPAFLACHTAKDGAIIPLAEIIPCGSGYDTYLPPEGTYLASEPTNDNQEH